MQVCRGVSATLCNIICTGLSCLPGNLTVLAVLPAMHYVPPRRMELYPELNDNLSNAAVDGIDIQSGMTEPKSEEKLETWEEPGVKVFQ